MSIQPTGKGDSGVAPRTEGDPLSSEAPPAGEGPQPAPTTLGGRIKRLRQERDISLSRLADIAGVSKGYLHELENDRAANPSAEILYNIALTLDSTIAYLLGKRSNPMAEVSGTEPLAIPESLEQFAREDRIPEEDKRRLACVRYRNEQPKTAEDWRYLYETIKRVVKPAD